MDDAKIRFTHWAHLDETPTPLAARLADQRLGQAFWPLLLPALFVVALCLAPIYAAPLAAGSAQSAGIESQVSHLFMSVASSMGFSLGGLLFVQLYCLLFRKRLLKSLRDLMDLPSAMPQFAAEVIYKGKPDVFGRDLGIVTFHPGLIDFNGRNSHFSIPAQNRPGFTHLKALTDNSLICQIQKEDYRLRIELSKYSGFEESPAHTFRLELKEARRARQPSSAIYYLPPACPNAEEIQSQLWTVKTALVAAVLWPLLVWAASRNVPQMSGNSRLIVPAVFAGVYVMLAAANWYRLIRLRKLKDAYVPFSEPDVFHHEGQVGVATEQESQQVTR